MKKRFRGFIALVLAAVMMLCGCAQGGSKEQPVIRKEETAKAQNTEQEAAQEAAQEESAALPHEEQEADRERLPHEADPEDQAQDGDQTLTSVKVQPMERPYLLEDMEEPGEAQTPSVPAYSVKQDLSDVYNSNQFYMNDTVKELLAKNLFCVVTESGYEFFEQYELNRYDKIPNFVTTDAMMHTYHLYFSYLLKNTEKNYLLAALKDLTQEMLANSLAQYNDLKGTEWETAALRNCAFFATAASLLGLPVDVPEEAAQIADAELALINDHSGVYESALTSLGQEEPAFEDYSQYTVRGYYEGDPELESYFRTMMWYGRMNFTQNVEDLNRSALLMTLAMQGEPLEDWEKIYVITSFFAGASDDLGYYEYMPAIDAVYGPSVSAKDLIGQNDPWVLFCEVTGTLKPPQINSIAVFHEDDTDVLEENKGFRFMGQRFSMDAAIFEHLIYDSVGANSAGEDRRLPDALDIPAAMGSEEAYEILMDKGAGDYQGYTEKMEEAKAGVASAPDTLWNASLYSKWLDTLNPLLNEKRDGWPAFMQSDEWLRKDLLTYLGSYAELKHDTVLYSKQVMAEMGGNDTQEWDDRGYVEPEPVLFGKLSALTQATADGLSGYGVLSDSDRENLDRLAALASSLQVIAEKELRDETLTDDEYELIRGFGGSIEHFWQEVNKNETETLNAKKFPAAVVTDIATDPLGSVLEVGTGKVSTIYVVVPVDGILKICSGSVYSFYEFDWPLNDRLTDTKWRQMMGVEVTDDGTYAKEPAFSMEDWTRDFQYCPREHW